MFASDGFCGYGYTVCDELKRAIPYLTFAIRAELSDTRSNL
jgi:hypothetical protein